MDILPFSLILLYVLSWNACKSEEKVCKGSSWGIHQSTNHLETYQSKYTNCTLVDGNLEIMFLNDQKVNYNLTFLKDIKEVTGYVLIVEVIAEYLSLDSLRIIRGRTLYSAANGKEYALYVALNYAPNNPNLGLKELGLKSLHEIGAGNIYFLNNRNLCYENTIVWNDIIMGERSGTRVEFHSDTPNPNKCGECHPSCKHYNSTVSSTHCWGAGPNMCQKFTRLLCSPQCEGRCFGERPNQCCHPQCAGGCSGPTKADCWACKNFTDDDICVPFCPPTMIYDETQYKLVKNPNAKYAYGTICVEKCPSFLVLDSGACVKECAKGFIAKNGECEKCDGPCPKNCPGTGADFLHANNIEEFRDCTIVTGSLEILESSVDGDGHRNIPGLDPRNFTILENIHEINGHLTVQVNKDTFREMPFFRSLEVIHGRELDHLGASLFIHDTSLRTLDFDSLKEIRNGRVILMENNHLCFAENVDWSAIKGGDGVRVTVKNNKAEDTCVEEGNVCHEECAESGCWGPADTQCLSCRNYRFGKKCIRECFSEMGLYDAGNDSCKSCHEECSSTCTGPGPDKCDKCKNVQDGPNCLATCPIVKYADENGICQYCNVLCSKGCTGPKNIIGEGGCNWCELGIERDGNSSHLECLRDNDSCPKGYFLTMLSSKLNTPMAGKRVCQKCHDVCETCYGKSTLYCETCKYLEQDGSCVKNCHVDSYADYTKKKCTHCHELCLRCTGPTEADCHSCRLRKVYLDEEKKVDKNEKPVKRRFNCTTDDCPGSHPHKGRIEVDGDSEQVCSALPITGENRGDLSGDNKVIIGVVVGLVVFILMIVFASVIFCRQRAKAKEATMKLTARMSGLEESEPLTPTDARPDMAMLRLVKESELRKGNIIGSGAFGTVYKGVWIPTNENVKIPVAIKVLQEGTSPSLNKELLEEARVMASVDHVCCIRILAVCMTAQMMLITQLMPLGCLLDYVRKNKSNIGSQVLLNWCTQIARGMAYLEERGIVHRDLAARNVLVQSPKQVKITDFGLAKLLDYNEEEYHAAGGKMPIKWLALECIQHRIFTHKSDVWSYGVTMWELFTYGQRPYESIRAKDVPDLLEKGERLPQPSICTIDVYMIMIKCWMLDADSRPNFKELGDEFAKMARDPGRYLVITGDKYMRLPSHTFDTQDLIRGISVAEGGPEQVMNAEDYLQPTSSVIEPRNAPSINGKLEKLKEENSDYDNDRQLHHHHHGRRTPAPATPNHVMGGNIYPFPYPDETKEKERPGAARAPGIRDKKYAGLEAQAKRKQESPYPRESINSRYSSDPCRIIGAGRDDGASPYSPHFDPQRTPSPHCSAPASFNFDSYEPPAESPRVRSLSRGRTPSRSSRSPGSPTKMDGINEENEYLLSDHTRFPYDYKHGVPQMPAPPTPLPSDANNKKPSFSNLPVDEDDYLQPKSSKPDAYLDLIDSKDNYYLTPANHGNDQIQQPPNPSYLDMSPKKQRPRPNAIQNPEYFENPRNGNSITLDPSKLEKQPLRTRSMSSDSGQSSVSSPNEHNYYNEHDIFNRRKNRPNNQDNSAIMFTNPRTESTV